MRNVERFAEIPYEEIVNVFTEMTEEFMFVIVPDKLLELFGEGVVVALLYEMVREGGKRMAARVLSELGGVDSNGLSVGEALKLFLILKKRFYNQFEYELRETDGTATLEITECPHRRYVEGRPYRCVSCVAMLSGFVEQLTGKRIQIIYQKRRVGAREPDVRLKFVRHMPLGHGKCVLELSMTENVGTQ